MDAEKAQALTDHFITTLAGFAAEGSSVAIPGFGTFTPVQRDERIVVEPDGSRTLVPPSVAFEFAASVILRKKLQ